ncbi:MAG: hypothetical protein A4E53_01801 [Pelotomaculum sp. PtaB.Bin104]|nr:MAG: hypothetical protein A4E53_01801 [Pelotomaculum sp. PtaB.Bin104]
MQEELIGTKGKRENDHIPVSERFIFKLGLADVLRLTMFGTLIAITKDITRLPLHVPGHSSIYWMGILVLGKGLIPKFGAGMIMGIISGALAVLLGLGKEGVFVFFKYFIPGLLLDLIAPFFNYRLENPFVGAICGTLTSLAKLVVNLALAVLLKLPTGFIALGLGFSSLTHTVFGAAGGIIAAILIKRLKPRLTNWE